MNALLRIFIDPFRATADQARTDLRFTPAKTTWLVPVAAGIVLLALSIILGVAGAEEGHFISKRFLSSYLIGWTFCLTIALGALFWVMIQHITRAYWSVSHRRLPEFLMVSFPMLAVLSIPILLGMHDLYHWTHPEVYDPASSHYDAVLAGKEAYLNMPFFLVRLAVYFAAWIYLSHRLYRLSVRQDIDPDHDIPRLQRRVSAWGIPVFAVTLAFAGFDLLMSLDPHWFSTMFGVYFFAGSFFAVLASITLFALLLQRAGYLREYITTEHYHDLGKFMFAFTVFWAYIAFSQYMLIWYGGIPEETLFYRHRMEHGYQYLSLALLVGHFFIPFLVLVTRIAKRTKLFLGVMSVWFLIMHFVDLYWVAAPQASKEGFHPQVLDITCWLGLGALFVAAVIFRASRHSTVAHNDPYLAKSLAFENA